MAIPPKTALDPFRAVVGVIDNSDELIGAATAAGLRIDLTLNEKDAGSHKNRIRVLLPRVLTAYDALGDQDKLIASRAAVASLSAAGRERATAALGRLGWELRDGEIVVGTPELREMFFPAGSQWDAFVVLRDVFGNAQADLMVVDPYCDRKVFQLLAGNANLNALHVSILCNANAAEVRNEGNVFTQQHGGVAIEVRRNNNFHDRFIVLDGTTCVHVGASLNHAGSRAFMVSRVEDDQNRQALLAQIQASWNAGTVVP